MELVANEIRTKINIGETRGCGKSTLMKEFASRSKEFLEGPSLYTDFRNVEDPKDVETLLSETISPLFLEIILRYGELINFV